MKPRHDLTPNYHYAIHAEADERIAKYLEDEQIKLKLFLEIRHRIKNDNMYGYIQNYFLDINEGFGEFFTERQHVWIINQMLNGV